MTLSSEKRNKPKRVKLKLSQLREVSTSWLFTREDRPAELLNRVSKINSPLVDCLHASPQDQVNQEELMDIS
jgi:hypothetical protein